MVRAAIATGDRPAALRLLHDYVRGQLDLSGMPVGVGDALVETASGKKTTSTDGSASAVVELRRMERAREQVIRLLQTSRFGSADLAVIRRTLDSLELEVREVEAAERRKDLPAGFTTEARRLGSVWLELKYIPDADSGRVYGPYLYGRWRQAGRKRSRYIGKPST
jgi:hypothetical protein